MKPIEKEFSQGVKILLERMESNPEDFVGGDDPPYHPPKFGMFSDLMKDVIRGDRVRNWEDWYLFTKAEQSALIQTYKNMMRARFDQGIMKKLLEEPEDAGVRLRSRPHPSNGPITIDQITKEALETLEKEFDKEMLQPKKFMLNPSQVKMAQKMGMSPAEYAVKVARMKEACK
jgi:hypothetical protein